MNKFSDLQLSVQNAMTDAAKAAFESGNEGNRSYGAKLGIEVGDEFHLTGIDFRSAWMSPKQDDDSRKAFAVLSDEDKKTEGVERRWFEFLCDEGTLSFGAVMGNVQMYVQSFWQGENCKAVDNIADLIKNAKLFKPSCRRPADWLKQGCDGLIGKTLKCVGVGEIRLNNGNVMTVRAFTVQNAVTEEKAATTKRGKRALSLFFFLRRLLTVVKGV